MFNIFKKSEPKTSNLSKPVARNVDSQIDQQLITLHLSGLHCSSCAVNIDLALEDLPGVKEVRTNYAKSQTRVNFDQKTVTLKAIIREINKLGYQVNENS